MAARIEQAVSRGITSGHDRAHCRCMLCPLAETSSHSNTGRTIAIAQLEVWRSVQEGLAELVLQPLQAVVPGRDALVACQEVVFYLLVPMDVSQEVHPASMTCTSQRSADWRHDHSARSHVTHEKPEPCKGPHPRSFVAQHYLGGSHDFMTLESGGDTPNVLIHPFSMV